MILTCPECATSYFVDDARIPPEGRTVKCAACGARWRAAFDVEPEPEAPPEPEAETEPALEAAADAAPDVAGEPKPEVADVAPSPERLAAQARRAKASETSQRRGRATALAWGGMAALVAALVGGAVVFREELVRLWPQSGAAFAGLGLPVNTLGLVIEGVKAEMIFQEGRPVLAVTGAIRNIEDHAIRSPPLKVSLLDAEGRTLGGKVAKAANAKVPAGARRYFAVAVTDPPAGLKDLDVAFETAKVAGPAAHATPAGAPATHATPAGAPAAAHAPSEAAHD